MSIRPGVFLPLTTCRFDPDATVVIFRRSPIEPNEAFDCMNRAASVVGRMPDRLIYAAIADRPEMEYGWIQQGKLSANRAVRAASFHESRTRIAPPFHDSGFINTLNGRQGRDALGAYWAHHPMMMQRFELLRRAIGTVAEAPTDADLRGYAERELPRASWSVPCRKRSCR